MARAMGTGCFKLELAHQKPTQCLLMELKITLWKADDWLAARRAEAERWKETGTRAGRGNVQKRWQQGLADAPFFLKQGSSVSVPLPPGDAAAAAGSKM